MARIRTIKPEFCTSEQVVECSPIARLLFVELLMFCDDMGRHPLSLKKIKMECFPGDPFTPDEVLEWICELNSADLIRCYEHDDGPIIEVTGWRKHQKIERPVYKYGPMNEKGEPVKFDDMSTIDPRGVVDMSTTCDPRNGMEWSLKEGKGVISSVVDMSTTQPAEPSLPVLLTFPCNGNPRTWNLTQDRVDEWHAAYPTVDILSEAKKALAWLKANGLKTARGMPRFLVGWMGRCNDRQTGKSPPGGFRQQKQPPTAEEIEAMVRRAEAKRAAQNG